MTIDQACAEYAHMAQVAYVHKSEYSSEELFKQAVKGLSDIGVKVSLIGYNAQDYDDAFSGAFAYCLSIVNSR